MTNNFVIVSNNLNIFMLCISLDFAISHHVWQCSNEDESAIGSFSTAISVQ
jgi:hypothetical protein